MQVTDLSGVFAMFGGLSPTSLIVHLLWYDKKAI